MKAITSERMMEIEEKAHQMGMLRVLMMENAGGGVADYVINKFKKLDRKKIVVIAGTGNNGGDAFVAARHLASYNAKITVILLGSPADLKTEESRINWNILERMNSIDLILAKEMSKELLKIINHAHIIIDGIFGIGIKGTIKEPHASVIDTVNKSKAYKVAVDLPSGLNPDTGEVHDRCVKANATITFHRMKKGLPSSKSFCGKIIVEPIGIPPEAEQ
ncbi:MAG: NAD(P)H-hydrate epimerase [Nitrososphaerales archaeon]